MRKHKANRDNKVKPAGIQRTMKNEWCKEIKKYFGRVKKAESEQAKSECFLLLLNDLFGMQPGFIEGYIAGIEKVVKKKKKDRICIGRIDELFGNLIIEFERDFVKNRVDAEEQLRKYVAYLWSQESPEKRTPYLCIGSDGVNFAVYSPTAKDLGKANFDPNDVQLKTVEEVTDLSTSLALEDFYFWLDRYFCRKQILSPRSESFVRDFGARSHAFQVSESFLLSLWEDHKEEPEFSVVYDSWEKYLRIVYGTSVAEDVLFCRHTYLATLAKLMAWKRLSGRLGYAHEDDILSLLEGHFFKDHAGIENFLVEDFFSWIIRKDARHKGIEVTRLLLSLLANYDLGELSEDVLKSLYQELVDPRTRHDLGEFYTPDWLAHRMVRRLMVKDPKGSFLDPSCGSGTFLYHIIRDKRDHLKDTKGTLDHILSSVYGIDIHPLAVIIAKTNYVLALGQLLRKRKGQIRIPVYLGDSVRLPVRRRAKDVKIPVVFEYDPHEVEIEGKRVYFSKALIENPSLHDEAIESAKTFATSATAKPADKTSFYRLIKTQYKKLPKDKDTREALFFVAEILRDFIHKKRDTIWAFVLKNIYKPLCLRGKFDFVVGNPPWLAFHYADPNYQKFLRGQIVRRYELLSGKGELITHLELGTLFLVHAADVYLKPTGHIAFVLPRSVFSADQHNDLRRGWFSRPPLSFKEIWDLDKVTPVFNVPACVLFGQKKAGARISYPIPGETISGKLEKRDSSLDEARSRLKVKNIQFYLHRVGKRSYWSAKTPGAAKEGSYYRKHFYQGATIVPRSFWFVQVTPTPLGIDLSRPPLESSEQALKRAKEPYKRLVMRGNMESEFLYATLLSTDILPFGHLGYRLVVLPIEPRGHHHALITVQEAQEREFTHLATWLEKVERNWKKRRGEKAKRATAIEWLDYRRKLTGQDPLARYRVIYNTSGTFLTAVVIGNEAVKFETDGQIISARGFLVDYVTYYLETPDPIEAYYLSAILNAPKVDMLIKPMQARGLWGPRHICKKVLELPIPQFSRSDKLHLQLSELGKASTTKVAKWVRRGGPGKTKSIGVLRRRVREMLTEELSEIDALVEEVMRA